MAVLATKANMRKYAVPPKKIGQITVNYEQPFTFSYNTEERFSANPGDYFMLGEDEVLKDSEGNEMFLVFERRYIEAADGEA